MDVFWIILAVGIGLTVGFLFGLLVGRSTVNKPTVGELIIGTDGEDYTMRLDIDTNVTGVAAEQYLMARDKVMLDIHPVYFKHS